LALPGFYWDLVGARLAAALVIDDFKTYALIFLQELGVHQMVGVNEDIGAAIIRNDKSEALPAIRRCSFRHICARATLGVFDATNGDRHDGCNDFSHRRMGPEIFACGIRSDDH
jgi:hypothetical protein